MTREDARPARSRRAIAALFAADAVSLSGNAAALVAIPWFVLQTTGSATSTGLTAAAALLGVVISGALGGALVDRIGHRRTAVLSDLVSGATVAAIPLLHATTGVELWQLIGLVFVGGLLDTAGSTARAALLPEAAESAGWTLERANGASAAVERTARLVGAPIAAGAIALFDAPTALWLDAATFLVSAVIVVAGVGPIPSSRRTARRRGTWRNCAPASSACVPMRCWCDSWGSWPSRTCSTPSRSSPCP